MNVAIRPRVAGDREEWERLARAYKAFYQTVLPDVAYERTWQRLLQHDGIQGFGVRTDGRLLASLITCFTPASGRRRSVILKTCSWNLRHAGRASDER